MRKNVSPEEWIASSRFLLVNVDHEERLVTARVGRPYDTGEGSWACPVETEGLHGRSSDIHGEDALQSLCLAISSLRFILESFVDKGGKILDPEDRTEWDRKSLGSIFGKVI